MKVSRIYCKGISYRAGFIEVVPNIHQRYINVEMWNIHPDFNSPTADIRDGSAPDEDVTGNVELELDVAQARQLVALLNLAIEAAEE